MDTSQLPDLPDGYYGIIGEKINETDYRFGANIQLPVARHKFQDSKIEYNQKEVSYNSCTLHGAIGAVSDLTGISFSLEDRKSLWSKALTLGASDSWGWYISDAVDLVREYWNEKTPNDQLFTFVCNVGDSDFMKALSLGYSVVTGFSGNGAYNTDYAQDNVLDGLAFGAPTYGHCIRISDNLDGTYALVIDNYPYNKATETYKIPKTHFLQLVGNKVFFNYGYVFVLQSDYNALSNPAPSWATQAVELAKQKGIIDASVDVNKEISLDPLVENSLYALGICTQKIGKWTIARWLTVLQKMGVLK